MQQSSDVPPATQPGEAVTAALLGTLSLVLPVRASPRPMACARRGTRRYKRFLRKILREITTYLRRNSARTCNHTTTEILVICS
ncbi:hypothetical protein PYCCODRAFT_912292 [Trametes coccinea BRFM310]|uniref:Uncharacterized protein n=1 Tax=Trametes coccinea (strain BRFM310) TaxID=1353009 RepID=A0A1Y2ICA0_TRAC3|nr:hypothetical protein PYCCODRAFT_912292 [Trametes coccinea BRFM310]